MPRSSRSGSGSSSASTSDSDPDDEIVHEMPVFYTPKLLSSLTLLQYPDRPQRPETNFPLVPPSMRPDQSPPQRHTRLQARYKPMSQHFQVDVPIERNDMRFDDDRGRELAQGVIEDKYNVLDQLANSKQGKRGRAKKQELDQDELLRLKEERDNRKLEHITYASTVVPDVTNYLVGLVKEDGLHLSPVTQTFQMRPKLQYHDNIATLERRRKREAKMEEDADSEGDISDTEIKKEEAKAVQLSVKTSAESSSGGLYGGKGGIGPGNGRAGAGLFAPLRAEEGESWTSIDHYHADSPQSSLMLNNLLVSDAGRTKNLASTTRPKEYLVGKP
ncbi:hypothetical protein OIO90_001289 [Microbotryomycetes sp. JL221]|nr:hypothetical protein OIO90_001289 [Microbotryomycetes sp. JL221]